jgi:sulfur carrier protein
MQDSINITFNGHARIAKVGMTVAQLLQEAEVKARFVVVELNGEIVPRDLRDSSVLKEGDILEVVTLVGGG